MNRIFFAMLFACTTAIYAVQTPYLIGLTHSTSGGKISIMWRNNDVNTKEFIIFRAASNTFENSTIIKNISVDSSTTVDSTVNAETKYYYALRAVAGTDTSAFSNSDSIVTKKVDLIAKKPIVQCVWVADSEFLAIGYFDSCNYEEGYVIKLQDFKTGQIQSEFVKSVQPSLFTGFNGLRMRSVFFNTTYKIWVGAVCTGYDTLWSDSSTNYTIKAKLLLDAEPVAYLDSLLSEFPLSPDISNPWCAKIGDTILCNENSGISIIDISNRKTPIFKKKIPKSQNFNKVIGNRGNILLCVTSNLKLNSASSGFLMGTPKI